MNPVLKAMTKTAKTWNDAVSHTTSGSALLDYWSKAGTYSGRSQAEVDNDMVKIFAEDEALALKVLFGVRLITRKPNVLTDDRLEGELETQTGYGRKDEFAKGFAWLLKNKPELAYKNLHLVPVFGCWKDLLNPLLVNAADRGKVYRLFADNLNDHLLRKYLPAIYSPGKKRRRKRKSKVFSQSTVTVETVRCHTPRARLLSNWARGFASFLGLRPVQYRKIKRDGTAHQWQQLMSMDVKDGTNWGAIDFNKIPGRAMFLYTTRKGRDKKTVFERHGQVERLKAWVLKQKTVKFTGYPHDLTVALKRERNPSELQKLVYDRQWDKCVEGMKGHGLGNVLCAIDTSGSMRWECSKVAKDTYAIDVCLALGLAFSQMNTGYFKNAVVAFNNNSTLRTLPDAGFCDRFNSIRNISAGGGTNFQSVIDLLVNIRKQHPEIPLDQYPETLLIVSDMQFNPTPGAGFHTVPYTVEDNRTNYEVARKKLQDAGLPMMRIIWWQVNGTTTDFPVTMDEPGVYLVGGFDPVVLKGLMGLSNEKKDFVAEEKAKETPMDGMLNFLGQPIFSLLRT